MMIDDDDYTTVGIGAPPDSFRAVCDAVFASNGPMATIDLERFVADCDAINGYNEWQGIYESTLSQFRAKQRK